MHEQPRNVMVTHADEPLGRRIVKRLYFDDAVGHILAVGAGPPPRAFDRYLGDGDGAVSYARVDLTRHRPVADLFHSVVSGRASQPGIDTLIHLPDHSAGPTGGNRSLARVPDRTAEARLVLQHCLESSSIRHLIALGSAYVYRLEPGNANRLTEQSELDLDPDLPGEARAWVDCDMLFHGELGSQTLRVALLRVPSVVSASGDLLMSPITPGGPIPPLRALGFDPMCALVADNDVCSAVRLALHRRATGIFNIAGRESLPMSVLARWTGAPSYGVPGPLLRTAAGAARLLGAEGLRSSIDSPHVRYGLSLDTSRARRELGFEPGYRIGLGRRDTGELRIERSPI
jgi:nucleoside-diphosphate-sugar epimerase